MKFSEIPYFLLKGYLDKIYQYNVSSNQSALLIGGQKGIVAYGGDTQQFFIDDPNLSYTPIQLEPIFDNYFDKDDKYKVNFARKDLYSYSDTLDIDITDTYQSFQIYSLTDNDIEITNGTKVYIRKGSAFHNWISDFAATNMENDYGVEFVLRNYINTDKTFIYFGSIYANSTGFNINFYNLHNFIIDSVPPHQRTEKLKELFFLHFDVLHNEQYGSLKDILSLLDPQEIKSEYLNYLTNYFSFNVDDYEISTQAKRNITSDVINLIKEKGTYTSLFILWKLITDNTTNRLNIYEKWQYKEPFSDFSQLLLMQARKDERVSFSKVIFPDSLISNSSTNITCSDGVAYIKNAEITETKEVSASTWTFTTRNEDLFKQGYSVSQVRDSTKNIIFPDSIKSLNEKFLEVEPFNETHSKEYDYRFLLSNSVSINDNYIYDIKHNLNDDIIISVFENDLMINPYKITLIDDNDAQIITKDQLNILNSYANIITVDFTENFFNKQSLTVNHSLDSWSVIVQIIDDNGDVLIPNELNIIDKNSIGISFNELVSGKVLISKGAEIYEGAIVNTFNNNFEYIQPDRIYEDSSTGYLVADFNTPVNGYMNVNPPLLEVDFTSALKTWNITHEFNSTQLMVQVRDGNTYIIPENIEFLDYNTIKITFPEEQTGTALIGRGFEIDNITGSKYQVSDNAWNNYLYTNLYDYVNPNEGVGSVFYNKYRNVGIYPNEFDEEILSTHYLIEMDLSSEPLENDSILSENMSTALYNYWEQFRPINRVADYNVIISPVGDLSGEYRYKYSSLDTDAYLKTKSLNTTTSLDNTYIGMMSKNSVWTVNHNLNSKNVLLQVFNNDLEEIVPISIQSTNVNTLTITFNEEISGYVFVIRETSFNNEFAADYTITINNVWDTKEVMTQVRDENENVVIPSTLRLIDEDTISIDLLNADIYTKQTDNVFDLLTSSNVTLTESGSGDSYRAQYDIIHNLNEIDVLVDVYNYSDNKIYTNVDRIDNNTIRIISKKLLDGYVIIDKAWANAFFDGTYLWEAPYKWNITHNLNTKNLIVQVRNTDNETIIPTNIQFKGLDEIELEFSSPIDGTIMITKGYRSDKTLQRYRVRHNQGVQKILTQFRDLNYNVIYSDIELIDEIYVGTQIGEGILSFHKPDSMVIQSRASKIWEITHNLDSNSIIYRMYNEDNEQIIPKSFQIVNNNKVVAEFDSRESGYIVISEIGTLWYKDLIDNGKFAISNEQNNINTLQYESDLTDSFEDDEYYYIRCDIPKDDSYLIKSIGLFNKSENEILFYTECSDIYKKENVSLTIFYKIKKETI